MWGLKVTLEEEEKKEKKKTLRTWLSGRIVKNSFRLSFFFNSIDFYYYSILTSARNH